MTEIDKELWAARQALYRLQRKLETLPSWRDSLAWEAVQEALNALGVGVCVAYSIDSMPEDFKHWREKYARF